MPINTREQLNQSDGMAVVCPEGEGQYKNISFDFLLFSYGSFRKCLAVIFHIKSVVDTLVSFMSYTEACVRTKGLVKIERAFSIFAVESVIPPRYWHWHRQ